MLSLTWYRNSWWPEKVLTPRIKWLILTKLRTFRVASYISCDLESLLKLLGNIKFFKNDIYNPSHCWKIPSFRAGHLYFLHYGKHLLCLFEQDINISCFVESLLICLGNIVFKFLHKGYLYPEQLLKSSSFSSRTFIFLALWKESFQAGHLYYSRYGKFIKMFRKCSFKIPP